MPKIRKVIRRARRSVRKAASQSARDPFGAYAPSLPTVGRSIGRAARHPSPRTLASAALTTSAVTPLGTGPVGKAGKVGKVGGFARSAEEVFKANKARTAATRTTRLRAVEIPAARARAAATVGRGTEVARESAARTVSAIRTGSQIAVRAGRKVQGAKAAKAAGAVGSAVSRPIVRKAARVLSTPGLVAPSRAVREVTRGFRTGVSGKKIADSLAPISASRVRGIRAGKAVSAASGRIVLGGAGAVAGVGATGDVVHKLRVRKSGATFHPLRAEESPAEGLRKVAEVGRTFGPAGTRALIEGQQSARSTFYAKGNRSMTSEQKRTALHGAVTQAFVRNLKDERRKLARATVSRGAV